MNVDFIFDFASPNSYLCYKTIPKLEKNYNIKFNYVPCLLGGIFKLTNNQAPMIAFGEIPNKIKYEFETAFNRFMQEHNIDDFKMNEHFPLNTLLLQRGAIAAQKNGFFDHYIEIIMRGMWEESLKLDDQDIFHAFLEKNDCHASLLIQEVSNDEIKSELINNTNQAVERGAFGVPTFFINDEMFFGKESLREIKDLALS